MKLIRQGATHKVVLGPAVAVANGYVPVTSLTLSGADEAEVILHDNGTVVDIAAYTWAAITTADGYYHLTLQSGISGTVGHVTVVVNDDSLILPLREDFTVIEEAVYDALYAASAPGYLQPATAGRTLVVDAAGLADANMVKAGPTGSGTAQTAGDIVGDTNDIQARIPAALTGDGNIKADTLRVGGTLQTARDIGASVLLSSGTGTGQISLSSGIAKVDVDTIKTNPVVNGGTLTFPSGETLASTTNITAGTIATATNVTTVNGLAAGVITAASIAADAITDAKVASDVTIASVTGAVGSVTGAVGSVTGAVGSVTGNVTGSIGSLAAQAKTDVNAEVVDALATDTYAEPGQGTPAATATLAVKIGYLFKMFRNRKTQTSTVWSLYNDDATTVDQKATVADDGTTASKTEIATGP